MQTVLKTPKSCLKQKSSTLYISTVTAFYFIINCINCQHGFTGFVVFIISISSDVLKCNLFKMKKNNPKSSEIVTQPVNT